MITDKNPTPEPGDPSSLLYSTTSTLQRDGIHFRKQVYSATPLAALINSAVSVVGVRYLTDYQDHVQVFHEGEWVCTASRVHKPTQT